MSVITPGVVVISSLKTILDFVRALVSAYMDEGSLSINPFLKLTFTPLLCYINGLKIVCISGSSPQSCFELSLQSRSFPS